MKITTTRSSIKDICSVGFLGSVTSPPSVGIDIPTVDTPVVAPVVPDAGTPADTPAETPVDVTSLCSKATITSQVITFPVIDWISESTKSQTVPAFQDSIDAQVGVSIVGTCGEKEITLNNAPNFITSVPAIEPINGAFKINYNKAQANIDNVGLNIISYTVSFK